MPVALVPLPGRLCLPGPIRQFSRSVVTWLVYQSTVLSTSAVTQISERSAQRLDRFNDLRPIFVVKGGAQSMFKPPSLDPDVQTATVSAHISAPSRQLAGPVRLDCPVSGSYDSRQPPLRALPSADYAGPERDVSSPVRHLAPALSAGLGLTLTALRGISTARAGPSGGHSTS